MEDILNNINVRRNKVSKKRGVKTAEELEKLLKENMKKPCNAHVLLKDS